MFKNTIITGVKTAGIAMTFGAYHLYIMNERWKLQQDILRLENKIIEEQDKKYFTGR
jgi:hypothetical protein